MIEHEQQELDFLRTFWDRKAVIAYSLFALNIIIFILMEFAGGSTNPSTLLAFGVKTNLEIDHGEIWRFVTPIFLHIGLLHLAFNSYALWVVGPQVEKLYGGARFFFLYVMTGIAGVAASYWYHPYNDSAGASGAIFGLFGVLLVFSFRYRKTVPAFFTKAIGRGILLTVGINLVIGYMIPQVDNSAHIGGLIGGMVLAALVPFQKPGEVPGKAWSVVQIAIVLMIALSFFQVLSHYNGPGLSASNLLRGFGGDSSGVQMDEFLYDIQQGSNAFERSDEALSSPDSKHLSDNLKELSEAIKLLQHIPSVGGEADELSANLLEVLQKQYIYVEEVERTGKPRSDFLGNSPQSSRYRSLKRQIEKWLDSERAKMNDKNSN